MDLERELTCSICTELLYNPLTLLDCLHTFCGACLKEWFAWQAEAARTAPNPPALGTSVFTCPSCRASVRDTRHNSTVASLLDMVLGAQPEKSKPQSEKDEMDAKYKPGDKVLPELRLSRRTAEQIRADERDRHLIDEVREMSLREAVHGGSSASRTRRRREDEESRSRAARRRAPRETSANRVHSVTDGPPRERTQGRRSTGGDMRRRAEQAVRLSTGAAEHSLSDNSRTSSSGSRQMSDESLERQRRQIEHQSSLRSLISSSDAADIDMEREVEEFARQIQEEGLLDGLDLENIDLTNNDELSRRITEAYRRRQRERERLRREARERSRASSQHSYGGPAETRPQQGPTSSRLGRPTNHSRTPSTTSQSDERSRPPLAASANSNHLEAHDGQRRRRRTGSHSRDRSATVPVASTQPELRIGARSQTDLDARSNSLTASSERPSERPAMPEPRSVSANDVLSDSSTMVESPPTMALPFSARANGLGIPHPAERMITSPEVKSNSSRARPRDILVEPRGSEVSSSTRPVVGLAPSPLPPVTSYGPRSPVFQEPVIECNRCGKEDIQYELHYNCGECQGGRWNICMSCYRLGKGCLHWFGFGYGGRNKWEKQRRAEPLLPEPHTLLASRFLRPTAMLASSGEDKQAWTTEDPSERLQSGTFCAQCFAWANECYWRCDSCNEGEWGYCNDCVNQGRSCTHALLPLAHQPPVQQTASPPPSPLSPSHPTSSTMVVGLNATHHGSFKVMTFITTCDVCRNAIAPTQSRFHCFECVSSIVPNSSPGDYDICETCYHGLLSDGVISADNGPSGWRRCHQGHRMVIVGFQGAKSGQKRHVLQDLVGGRRLGMEPFANDPRTQRWTWYEGDTKRERIVARDAADTPRQTAVSCDEFPPDGGRGWRVLARWAWYPAAGDSDELLFPKGAEIREVEDANREWYHGVYMGSKGLFPSNYVRELE